MAGTCRYCGYSGTNEMMMEHAGSCPVMNFDYSPEDTESKLGEIKMQLGTIDQLFMGREIFENDAFIQKIEFIEEKKDLLISQIEETILDWLKSDDNDDSVKTLYLENENMETIHIPTLQFYKSEIYIKSCSNVWEVWRIANSPNWPRLISWKVKEIGVNDYYVLGDSFHIPNEVKTINYKKEEIDTEDEKRKFY